MLKSMWIWVDVFSAGIEPGTCGEPNLLSPTLFTPELRWRMNHRKSLRTFLVFVLRRHRKLESAMGQDRRIGEKGWTHTSLVDYFMVTKTFQTWFHHYITVSYCGPLLLRLHLVVRSNDNWPTVSNPHLWDVSRRRKSKDESNDSMSTCRPGSSLSEEIKYRALWSHSCNVLVPAYISGIKASR